MTEKNKLKANLESNFINKISTTESNVFQKNLRIASRLNKFVSSTITGAKTLNAATNKLSDLMKGKNKKKYLT